MELTHYNICKKGATWIKKNHLFTKVKYHSYSKCSVCDLARYGESPDVFAFGGYVPTQLIEVKISRQDFLADKKKPYRKEPEFGLGQYRSYLCPTDLIKPVELPKYWGLLYINESGEITKIVPANEQVSYHIAEIDLVRNLMRREGVKKSVFNYKGVYAESLKK